MGFQHLSYGSILRSSFNEGRYKDKFTKKEWKELKNIKDDEENDNRNFKVPSCFDGE
jgi:hypothetical protein